MIAGDILTIRSLYSTMGPNLWGGFWEVRGRGGRAWEETHQARMRGGAHVAIAPCDGIKAVGTISITKKEEGPW